MIKSKIFGKVQILRNAVTLVSQSTQFYSAEVFSVRTVQDLIKTYFWVQNEKEKWKYEFNLDDLHSINKKFINEGKTIFTFKVFIGKKVIRGFYGQSKVVSE